LQRAYDQIIHDVALQKMPVIFAVDRAGLVGQDGPTHHGPFDISYFRCVPNIVVSSPKDGEELIALLKTALRYRDGPFVIRYPRGNCGVVANHDPQEIPIGTWEVIKQGKDLAIIAAGAMVQECVRSVTQLHAKGLEPLLINGRFIKPLDTAMLDDICKKVKTIVTVEENALNGGFGSAIIEFFSQKDTRVKVHRIGLPDAFIEHGARDILLRLTGLNAEGIAASILALV
jgi:1-deoxy-D-xylulose-5-phosphate synthase